VARVFVHHAHRPVGVCGPNRLEGWQGKGRSLGLHRVGEGADVIGAEGFDQVVGKIEVLGRRALTGTAQRPPPLLRLRPGTLASIGLRKVLGSDVTLVWEDSIHLLPTHPMPQEPALSPELEDAWIPTEQVLEQGRARPRRPDDENGALQPFARQGVSHPDHAVHGIGPSGFGSSRSR
jgi:hypothetical protein